MSDEIEKPRGGVGPGDLLTLLFVGLKLTDKIDWSWWWVLSPTWGGIVLLLLLGLIGEPPMIVAFCLLAGGWLSGYIAGWVVGRYGREVPAKTLDEEVQDYLAVELARTNRLEIRE